MLFLRYFDIILLFLGVDSGAWLSGVSKVFIPLIDYQSVFLFSHGESYVWGIKDNCNYYFPSP